MVGLPEGVKGLKIFSLISIQYTNMTDIQVDRETPHDGVVRAMRSVARQESLPVVISNVSL